MAAPDEPVVVSGVPIDVPDGSAPVVSGAPVLNVTRQVTDQATERIASITRAPTAETKQKSNGDLFSSFIWQAILPFIILLYYYRDDWALQYCETDLAGWALVYGWLNAANVVLNYLHQTWFWRLKWDEFTRANEDGKAEILKQQRRLKIPVGAVGVATAVVFFVGQPRIWDTHSCGDEEYEMIVNGSQPVRARRPPHGACQRFNAPARPSPQGCTHSGGDTANHITCVEPAVPCCFADMHDFARVWSIVCFVFLGLLCSCICCSLLCVFKNGRSSDD